MGIINVNKCSGNKCQLDTQCSPCCISCYALVLLVMLKAKSFSGHDCFIFLMSISLLLCKLQSGPQLNFGESCYRNYLKVEDVNQGGFPFHRIPPPRVPPMNILSAVLTEAFGVALVGYVASLALAQRSAKTFKYSVDDNQVEYTLVSLYISNHFLK